MHFSIIIPTYNEEKNIVRTLDAIKVNVPSKYDYEVIVVDHGSTDQTVNLSRANNAKVYIHPEGTIGGLRNYGVKQSCGDILVFLDADVLLTANWGKHIGDVENELSEGKRILTGSWYSVPEDSKWIEKYWFSPLQHGGNTHINSGHLIITRKLFDELGGFDEKLETGEDYDISMRAKAAGLHIIDDINLKVIHKGYPKSLVTFVKREYWHGKGDAESFKRFISSKVSVIGLLFVVLHVSLFVAIYTSHYCLAAALAVSIIIIALGVSYIKYRKATLSTILMNSLLYYCYFWARGASVLSLPGMRKMRKRTR